MHASEPPATHLSSPRARGAARSQARSTDTFALLAVVVPGGVVALLAPRLGDSLVRLSEATGPFAPRLETLIGDLGLAVACTLAAWATLLHLAALLCRATRRRPPRVLLTLTPSVWRPVVAGLAGGAVLVAAPATTALAADSEPHGPAPGSAVGAAPPAAMLEGLSLPDRPGRLRPASPRTTEAAPTRKPRATTEAAPPRKPRATTAAPTREPRADSPTTRPRSQRVHQLHRVAPGESLWTIAADRVEQAGLTPTDRRVDREWRRWYAKNRARIGDDPSTLRVRLVLRVPDSPPEHTRAP